MPADGIIQSFLKKTDKTEEELKLYWDKAKNIVKDQYEITDTDGDFYPLVMGVFKKSLGFKTEEFSTGVASVSTGSSGGDRNVPAGGAGMGVAIRRTKKKLKKNKKPKITFIEYLETYL